MQTQKQYDAFLSHNNNDKPAVRQIARWLKEQAQLKVWFDEWDVLAGDVWQEEIEKALDQSRSCVVFLGPSGLGGWHNEEMRSAIEDRVTHKEMRVIPVLLPNTKIPEKESGLARFLRRHSYVEFRHDVNDAEALQRLACGIKGKQSGESASRLYETVCPFRGLEVFREEHAEFFFGRDNVVQRLQHYLQEHRFLAVIGPSGSGKSSVVQAGLIPALKRIEQRAEGVAQQSSSPSAPRPRPSALRPLLSALFTPQTDPFEGLAFALRPLMTQPPSYSQLIKDLTDNEKELEYISRGICRDTGAAWLLLVIDQFEEVFTQTTDEHKRQRFFASLLNTVEAANSTTLIVLTMRSDFLGKCAAYADLNTFIIDHLFQIGPMSAKDLRDAIAEPAQRVGLEFEKGLVEIMLKDAAGAPGELPLIEHALLELYERRNGNQLTQAAYAEIGGISGALAKRAEAEFARLTPTQQEILRKMFVLRLIQPGEGTEDTRHRATKEELLAAGGNAKETETVLQHLTDARLLTTTRDEEKKQEIVDVAHEALIRTWPKVQDWLKEARETSRLLSLVRHGAQEWVASGKSADYFWLGSQLARAEELYAQHAEDLTPAEKEFIQEGIVRRERESRARSLKLLWGSATIIILVLVVTAYLLHNWQKAQDESNLKLRQIYWEIGRQAREQDNLLLSSHLLAELGRSARSQSAAEVFIQDGGVNLQGIALKNILSRQGPVQGARCDHAGRRILTWSDDATARLWQAQTGQSLGQPMKHQGRVNGAVFDRAQARILTWSNDGTARLWEAETGQLIGQPMSHVARIRGAVFDQTQKRILTWSSDSTARLWEAATGQPIVRYVPAPEPPSRISISGPVHVLGIISSPTDQDSLAVDEEKARLEKALEPLIKSGRLRLTWLERATTPALQEALRRSVHVVHYIGHGDYDASKQEGELLFEDESSTISSVKASWLATLLRDGGVHLAFLNACKTGHAADGVAEVLVRREVPAALGMQVSVRDDVAIAFSTNFYAALVDGWPVDAAVVEGRKAIVNALNNDPNQPDWVHPVLYMRAPDGVLFG